MIAKDWIEVPAASTFHITPAGDEGKDSNFRGELPRAFIAASGYAGFEFKQLETAKPGDQRSLSRPRL